ncbi:MAG: hypothetical protein JNM31_12000 [Flavobacteriales bacterium]|nr:hypothetical protein [Flavobacteriales bacterium]
MPAVLYAQLNLVWQQLQDHPYPVYSPCLFEIDDRIYAADGITGSGPVTFSSALHEYDPNSDTWTPRTSCPGPDRYGARGFSIDGVGYMTCGWNNNAPVVQLKDLWAYDPLSDSWTQKADLPGPPRYTAITCATSSKGYVGLGYQPYLNDWWEYDPVTDTWTQRTPFPGSARQSAICFVINDQVYVGCGSNGTNAVVNDLWRYDPTADTWTQLADLPGAGRYTSYSFTYQQKGFVVCGLTVNSSGVYTELDEVWYYDPVVDAWSQLAAFPGAPHGEGGSCWSGLFGYMGMGRFSFGPGPLASNTTAEFWRVRPLTNTVDDRYSGSSFSATLVQDQLVITDASTSAPHNVVVLNVNGSTMHQRVVTGPTNLVLPTQEWPSGAYLVRCGDQTRRVLIAH